MRLFDAIYDSYADDTGTSTKRSLQPMWLPHVFTVLVEDLIITSGSSTFEVVWPFIFEVDDKIWLRCGSDTLFGTVTAVGSTSYLGFDTITVAWDNGLPERRHWPASETIVYGARPALYIYGGPYTIDNEHYYSFPAPKSVSITCTGSGATSWSSGISYSLEFDEQHPVILESGSTEWVEIPGILENGTLTAKVRYEAPLLRNLQSVDTTLPVTGSTITLPYPVWKPEYLRCTDTENNVVYSILHGNIDSIDGTTVTFTSAPTATQLQVEYVAQPSSPKWRVLVPFADSSHPVAYANIYLKDNPLVTATAITINGNEITFDIDALEHDSIVVEYNVEKSFARGDDEIVYYCQSSLSTTIYYNAKLARDVKIRPLATTSDPYRDGLTQTFVGLDDTTVGSPATVYATLSAPMAIKSSSASYDDTMAGVWLRVRVVDSEGNPVSCTPTVASLSGNVIIQNYISDTNAAGDAFYRLVPTNAAAATETVTVTVGSVPTVNVTVSTIDPALLNVLDHVVVVPFKFEDGYKFGTIITDKYGKPYTPSDPVVFEATAGGFGDTLDSSKQATDSYSYDTGTLYLSDAYKPVPNALISCTCGSLQSNYLQVGGSV